MAPDIRHLPRDQLGSARMSRGSSKRLELCDDSLVSNWRLSLGFSARQIPSGRAQWRTAGLFNAVMEPFNVVRSLN